MPLMNNHKEVLQDTIKLLYLSIKGIGSYPLNHPGAINPIEKFYQLIKYVLKEKKILTVGVGDGTLLVENNPIDGKYNFSSKFFTDLVKRNIESVSFFEGLNQTDLKTFLILISKQPDELREQGGIAKILEKEGISKIKVNEIRYERISQGSAKQKDIRQIENYSFNKPSPVEMDRVALEESEKIVLEKTENLALKEINNLTQKGMGTRTHKEIYNLTQGEAYNLTRKGTDNFTQKKTYNLTQKGTDNFTQKETYNLTRKGTDNFTQKETYNLTRKETDNFTQKETYNLTQKGTDNLIQKGRDDLTQKGTENRMQTGSKNLIQKEPHDFTLEKSEEFSLESPPQIIISKEGSDGAGDEFLAEYNGEIKGKIAEYLVDGKITEIKEIIHGYSRRLDDKSLQIRKSVTEIFHSILSELDQLDQLKENFCNLSKIFINKITNNLRQEDHVETYLTQTETLHMICNSYKNIEKYFVDETLGHRFYSDEKISKKQLQQLLETRKTNGKSLQYNLAALNYASEEELIHYLSRQFRGFSMVNISEIQNIPNNILESIPAKYAKRYYSLPFKLDEQKLFTALENPLDMEKISDLEFISGYKIVPFAAAEYYLIKSIERFYDEPQSSHVMVDQVIEEIEQENEDFEYIEEKEDETTAIDECESDKGPIVRLVNLILKESIIKKASDIHIEPYENELRVRLRIDGSLIPMMNPPFKYRNGVSSRIKIMSRLNISEKRLPQDGKFKIRMDDKCVDFRVSTFPGPFGEKVVMRLFDKSNLQIDIAKLGMTPEELKALTCVMYKSKGMILVTGPTGSGKSTTLYSVLQKLNDGTRNISTAEDPIEYNIPGINQFQMNPKIGLDFATALRSFLRQDPDILMVGEMRDLETAEIAVKASLTGHLVLSTLHTNNAIETITRLLEMGIEPFLVATSLDLIIAQRLVRKICTDCIEEAKHQNMPLDYLKKMGVDVSALRLYTGKGCPNCNNTGYKGRFAIYEVLPMWNEIREMIIKRESPFLMQKKAEQLGLVTLQRNGLEKVKQGITTIDELMRAAI